MGDVTTYGLELKEGHAPASFMAEGRAVELENDGDVFRTTDRRSYLALRALPFLEDLGELEGVKPTAADIVATIGARTDDELAELADDDRKTVAAAAAAELERRANDTGGDE